MLGSWSVLPEEFGILKNRPIKFVCSAKELDSRMASNSWASGTVYEFMKAMDL